ncbi:thiol:disulfide interchange protein DsbD [Winogradskyella wandonensis]|uniref:Thiol:disulfide interchange protein DsbD n=1 Tax=Winogradskyella wandonensis TaxID=1442586 RepID=A0A4R1KP90_9FLAO|nr:thioredoxin family protein [Winogradskyella wandonensis]TCK66865.1 thiol:disulfide interchange protein DsbD [Winogradskyella wandonensis]
MAVHQRLLFVILTLVFTTFGFSQNFNPASWDNMVEKISDSEYKIIMTVTVEDGYSIYSQYKVDKEGFAPETYFEFKNQEGNYTLIGKTTEPDAKIKYDPIFEEDVKKFQGSVSFTQKINLINPDFKQIEITAEYQTCNDERCILGDETFKLNLDGSEVINEVATIDERSKTLSEKLKLDITGWDKYEKQNIEEKSNFSIFILGFLGGLIALLTPCVFPMIPLTVSFFTKSSGDSKKGVFNSILYGFFIFLIYVLLSIPFHLLDSLDPGILNNISTNVTLNIIFFIIFIAFAFSFFGYYELTLPQSWSAKMDSKANKIGGFIGVFFMALTLAIVSFSCTGPILGTLLGSSLTADGGAVQLSMGMAGFGLALALPFTLFAMFPKWLNSLPKSGGWLNTVKVVLGFIELALALKFLSNADLVEHWSLLKREIFIGLWIIIGIGLILYLFGKIKFPHDGPLQKLGKGRITTGILVVAFVIYLIPGLTNTKYANLKLLSGFPPPMFYSLYEKNSECPLDLNCSKDWEEGLAKAKAENKPILLDFTGWACVNCRKMEEQVWSTSDVYDMLSDNYVIISLYVDDKKELPQDEQFDFLRANGTVKQIETIGDKWATLQTVNFENNSQPYYVLLNHDLELLNVTNTYEPNAEAYFKWLETGLKNFEAGSKVNTFQFK